MPYTSFDLTRVKSDFNLTTVETVDIFAEVKSVKPTDNFIQLLEDYKPLAKAASTEKAKSELLIAPILVEVRKLLNGKVSLFSGSTFNVEPALDLFGYVDFLLTKSEELYTITSPIVTIIEAKNNDINSGIGQCIAEMVAAQIFNRRESNNIQIIYGAVTNGDTWLFLKLKEKTIYIDKKQYFIVEIEKIIGILMSCFDNID